MPLSDDQRRLLDEPLDPKLVQIKPTTGKPRYIEGVEAFRAANRIFGPDAWGYTTESIERVDMDGGTLYRAIVTVTVNGCMSKQDVGCKIVGAKTPQGHETAMKGAVTDGVKRALRTFGDPLGLVLYDKDADVEGEYREWERDQGQQPAEQRPARPTPPARTVTTPAGAVATAPAPRPPSVTFERKPDGLAALDGVDLGQTGTDLFESLWKARDMGDLGAAWIAVNEHKSALGPERVRVLTLWKDQRKAELEAAPAGV